MSKNHRSSAKNDSKFEPKRTRNLSKNDANRDKFIIIEGFAKKRKIDDSFTLLMVFTLQHAHEICPKTSFGGPRIVHDKHQKQNVESVSENHRKMEPKRSQR